jgi:hypothetical protein
MNAYSWLSDRYNDGDKIFLFGKSSGSRIHFVKSRGQDFQEAHTKFVLWQE